MTAGTAAATLLVIATSAPVQAEGSEPWWYDAMQIEDIHEQTRGEGVKIAVIDGAINLDAPELDGADITLGEGLGDIEPGKVSGMSVSYPNAFYAGHGTAMTSLIVGQGKGTDGAGIVGMAPEAEVTFYQVDPDPADTDIDSFSGVLPDVLADEPDIISISLAGTRISETQFERIRESGAIVVAGAGEAGGKIRAPAAQRGVVSVGAVDEDAQVWDEQPQGGDGQINICAPGVDVASGGMQGSGNNSSWQSGIERTGTSSATAVVSGSLALVKSRWPEATGNQLLQGMIHAQGDAEWGWAEDCGFGVIKIKQQLELDPSGWPDENPFELDNGQAAAQYPPSVYQDPDAPEATDEPVDGGQTDTTEAAAPTDDSGGPPWAVIGISAIVLLAAAGGAIVWTRGRHSTNRSRGM